MSVMIPPEVGNIIQSYTTQNLRLNRSWRDAISDSVKQDIDYLQNLYPGERYLKDGNTYSTLFTTLQDAIVDMNQVLDEDEEDGESGKVRYARIARSIKNIVVYPGYLPIRWDLLLFSFHPMDLTPEQKEIVTLIGKSVKASPTAKIYASFIIQSKGDEYQTFNAELTKDLTVKQLYSAGINFNPLEYYDDFGPTLPLDIWYFSWNDTHLSQVPIYVMGGYRESLLDKVEEYEGENPDVLPSDEGTLDEKAAASITNSDPDAGDSDAFDGDGGPVFYTYEYDNAIAYLYYYMYGEELYKPTMSFGGAADIFSSSILGGYDGNEEVSSGYRSVSVVPMLPDELTLYQIFALDRPDLLNLVLDRYTPSSILPYFAQRQVTEIPRMILQSNIDWVPAILELRQFGDVISSRSIPAIWRKQAAYAIIQNDVMELEEIVNDHRDEIDGTSISRMRALAEYYRSDRVLPYIDSL